MLGPISLSRPATLDEALSIADELGEDGVWYGGGTELVPAMNLGLVQPKVLIDLKRIPALHAIAIDDGMLKIGACITYQELVDAESVGSEFHFLRSVSGLVGNTRVRHAGTFAGNLAFAEPRSDVASMLTAAGGTVLVRASGGGEREVAVADLFLGPYGAQLEVGELITEVRVPVPNGEVIAHERFQMLERPGATVSVKAEVADGRFVSPPRVVVGAATPVPTIAVGASEILSNTELSDAQMERAGEAAAEEIEPIGDITGSEPFKRHLVKVLTVRAVRNALGEGQAS